MRAFSANRFVFALLLGLGTFTVASCAVGENDSPLEAQIRSRAAAVEKKVIAWREDIHQHPELGQQELRTSHLVAQVDESALVTGTRTLSFLAADFLASRP
jgi:hypothetical protein